MNVRNGYLTKEDMYNLPYTLRTSTGEAKGRAFNVLANILREVNVGLANGAKVVVLFEKSEKGDATIDYNVMSTDE